MMPVTESHFPRRIDVTSGFLNPFAFRIVQWVSPDYPISPLFAGVETAAPERLEAFAYFIRAWDSTGFPFDVGVLPLRLVGSDQLGLGEMAWFDSHIDELRQQFGGLYVAIKNRNIVAAASTPRELKRLVRERGIEAPLITEITLEPGPEATAY
jgi:hypothetical protein